MVMGTFATEPLTRIAHLTHSQVLLHLLDILLFQCRGIRLLFVRVSHGATKRSQRLLLFRQHYASSSNPFPTGLEIRRETVHHIGIRGSKQL